MLVRVTAAEIARSAQVPDWRVRRYYSGGKHTPDELERVQQAERELGARHEPELGGTPSKQASMGTLSGRH